MADLNPTKYPNNIRTVTSAIPVTQNVFRDDVVLECDTAPGNISIDLLGIPKGNWSTQYKLYIVDAKLNAAANNIKINAGNGIDPTTGLPVPQTINGQPFVTINTNGGAVLIRIIDNYKYIATYNSFGLSGYTTIEEDGVPLPQRNTLNFVGKAITATDNITKTDVTVQAYTTVEEEGIVLPQRDVINFKGAGVTATDNGSKTEVTIPGASFLGNMVNIATLEAATLPVSPAGDRSVGSGTIVNTGWSTPQQRGTLVGTFNTATGIWTCPATGWYDISLLFSLAVDVGPYNNLVSSTNFNGFMGNLNAGPPPPPLLDPASTFNLDPTVTPLNFFDYFGSFSVAITNFAIPATLLICATDTTVTYNTSAIQLSASYCARYITAGTLLCARYLNKTNNAIVGQPGNSFHFSINHSF